MQIRSAGRHGPEPEWAECFAGQSNGICGAVANGYLALRTGTHSGDIPISVELHDGPPQLHDDWQDIVEVSFEVTGPVELATLFEGVVEWDLGVPGGVYRVRCCAAGMDDGPPGVALDERYLLQFWPAPIEADRIIRQTSATASARHREQRRT